MTEMITVHTKPCLFCGEPHRLEVSAEGFHKWAVEGEYVQNAFPELNSDDRELLLSGICAPCWAKEIPMEDDE